MRLFGFARRWTSLCLTRPVTPEVVGSSPVAPVETSCNSALLLSGSAETVAGFCAPRGDPARGVKEAGCRSVEIPIVENVAHREHVGLRERIGEEITRLETEPLFESERADVLVEEGFGRLARETVDVKILVRPQGHG